MGCCEQTGVCQSRGVRSMVNATPQDCRLLSRRCHRNRRIGTPTRSAPKYDNSVPALIDPVDHIWSGVVVFWGDCLFLLSMVTTSLYHLKHDVPAGKQGSAFGVQADRTTALGKGLSPTISRSAANRTASRTELEKRSVYGSMQHAHASNVEHTKPRKCTANSCLWTLRAGIECAYCDFNVTNRSAKWAFTLVQTYILNNVIKPFVCTSLTMPTKLRPSYVNYSCQGPKYLYVRIAVVPESTCHSDSARKGSIVAGLHTFQRQKELWGWGAVCLALGIRFSYFG